MADPDCDALASQAGYLVGLATRAPSVHNTQPWIFRVSGDWIELRPDVSRQLRADPDGRELLISCGTALYGLRLAIRSLGRQADVEICPGPERELPFARVRLGRAEPATGPEQKMLQAMSRRHTHRGPFEPGPLPAGLLGGLRKDASTEGAALAVIESPAAKRELAQIVTAAARRQDRDRQYRGEMWLWTRDAGSPARDGVPAHAFPATPGTRAGQVPQRDFDLSRGIGELPAAGPIAPASAVLCTGGDEPADWLRAGQALYRLLLHGARYWVFADLNTQPLENPAARARIRTVLGLPGAPQMLLQLGVSRVSRVTARRSAADLIEPGG